MTIILIGLVLLLGNTVGATEPHKWCYGSYPELSGLLCYKECKSSFKGVGPVCWGHCPPETTDIGMVCTKKSYTRGAGVPISYCPPHEEKSGALCYQKCKSGYYGVGPVCWQRCGPGYTDFGATCTKGWHTHAKNSYGRGWGHALWCRPEEEQSGALCYPKCRSGYKAVSFVCWAICTGDSTDDTGTQCQKKSYPRGVGKPINCVVPPKRSDITNWSGLVDILKKADGGFNALKAIGCAVIYTQVKPWIDLGKSLNGCLRRDDWTTISVSYTVDMAAIVSGGVEIGIAADPQSGKGMCYVGWCAGVKSDVSFGGSFSIGYWKDLGSITGVAVTLELGGDVPGTEIGADIALIFANNELIGLQFQFGVGVGLSPVDIGIHRCDTPSSQTIPISI